MSDKMREAFEKWAVSEGMPITRGHYYDVYASAETRAAYLAWQAAQAVPVVGEPVAYGVPNSRPTESLPFMQVMLQIPANAQYPELLVPLIAKPTHSITAAELERLRECEAALPALKEDCQTSNDCGYGTLGVGHVLRTIDAAMQEKAQ